MKRIGSFLVAAALIAGTAGCAQPAAFCNLTIANTEGGEVTSPGEGTSTYDAGEVVNLIAVAENGYRFANWAGDVSTVADPNAAATTITMNDNYSIMANFYEIPVTYYTLTLAVNGNGSTSPSVGQHTYVAGTVVSITAAPAAGYQFVNWTGNVHTIADVNAISITIRMNDDYSVIANFEAIPLAQYTLTISSTEGGSVTTPGQGTFRYAAGAVVDLVTESEEGYKFFTWTGDIEMMASFNASSSTAHNQPPMHFSITMEGNYAITAHFIPRWVYPDMIDPEL